MSVKKTKNSCPTCHKELIWSTENPYRPFCSERCKLIDLGEWADEGYKVPGERINNSRNQFAFHP
jgi:endogenous inhibitor of DNA gyrase (YacG/DUF329 family)